MMEVVKQLIHESNNIVVLSGTKMLYECGLDGMRAENHIYEIEEEYGYSPEEIMTTLFFTNRSEVFYDYYRKYVIKPDMMQPGPAHYAIAELEKQGKLSSVITKEIYGLHRQAGIYNMIELYGNVYENACPKCGKSYSLDYIMQSKGLPVCESCRFAIKPKISLFGETLDNGKISRSVEKVSKASVVLLVGTAERSNLASMMLPYYKGNKLVVINEDVTEYDEIANYVIHGKCEEILPQLVL